MNNVNTAICEFLKTKSPEYVQVRAGDEKTILGIIQLESCDGVYYKPKTIKINGVDGILPVFKSGQINFEFKIVKTNDGFILYRMTLSSYSAAEHFVSQSV